MVSSAKFVAVSNEFRDRRPRKLYRRFESKDHAERFIAGNIRFRRLASYRSIEDATRKDAHEGGRTQDLPAGTVFKVELRDGVFGAPITLKRGEFRVGIADAQDYFIACFSVRRNQAQRKFGPWLVTINHADSLITHMRKALLHPDCLFWGRVDYYDPSAAIDTGAGHMLWKQKPIAYKMEHEFRIGMVIRGHESPAEATAYILGADLSHVASLVCDP